MKARVKYNNEIIDIIQVGTKTHLFDLNNVEFLDNPQDYWTKLEHQYAGMAMQGMLANTSLMSMLFDATKDHDELLKEVIICSYEYAHALVEKMKEERK